MAASWARMVHVIKGMQCKWKVLGNGKYLRPQRDRFASVLLVQEGAATLIKEATLLRKLQLLSHCLNPAVAACQLRQEHSKTSLLAQEAGICGSTDQA